MNRTLNSGLYAFTVICILVAPGFAAQSDTSFVEVTIETRDYALSTRESVNSVTIPGFGNFTEPGKPKLPSRIFACAIPPGSAVLSVEIEAGPESILPGKYIIPPTAIPKRISSEKNVVDTDEQKNYEQNYRMVYTRDEPYPTKSGEMVRSASYRRYNLVDVKITPFSYRPLSGKLIFHSRMTVRIHYRPSDTVVSDDVLYDYLPRTEKIAREIIHNYDEAQQWYPAPRMINPAELHSLVIIAPDYLVPAVNSFMIFQQTIGLNPVITPLNWIDTNFEGVDLAEKMRNFLRNYYPSTKWGIENVLLIGDHTQTPMRKVWPEAQPRTDFYLAELSLPDSESWDSDHDGKYFENGDNKDFYSEVHVGRIPWNDYETVQSICQKSVIYHMNDDVSFKKNILLLGAFFWEDTDCAYLMEKKVDQPWMADWSKVRLYEKNDDFSSIFPCDYPLNHNNVTNIWSTGTFAFVNWAGHGSPISAHVYGLNTQAFIKTADCPKLNNDFPAIIFADACSNSDTDYPNIGKQMLKTGAVGFVGATKYAYGCGNWRDPADGSSQSLDYYFTTAVTSGAFTQGEAHQRALRTMYTEGLWYYPAFEMCEWNLWGNPCLSMSPPDTSALSPVYRFWSDRNQSHFYTISMEEYMDIMSNYTEDVWRLEGISWYAHASQKPDTLPVFRFWSGKNQSHFYTISEEEKNYLLNNYTDDEWHYEGIAWYAYPDQEHGNIPVYRFWSENNQSHFYTKSVKEKNYMIANYHDEVWHYQGIAWYWL